MSYQPKKYEFINYIKVFAAFAVTAVHFRHRTEDLIPVTSINNFSTLFYSLDYAFFVAAVPLFILATGFISTHRKPNKKHWLSIVESYGLYIFLALISYSVMVYVGIRDPLPFAEKILKAMQFNLVGGWYVELYIGLALFIPFFNIMLNNMDEDMHLKFIIISFIAISIPAFVNANPFLSEYIALPNFWSNMYPMVYYAIGSYFRKTSDTLNISNTKLMGIITFCIILITGLLYFNADPYTSAVDGYYPSIVQVVLASSIFLLFKNSFTKENKTINFVSRYTLGIYLLALPVDRMEGLHLGRHFSI